MRLVKRYLYIILLLGFVNCLLFCSEKQADTSAIRQSITATMIQDLKIGFNDAVDYFGAPLHFGQREGIIAASGIAATVAIMFTDKEIKRLVEKDKKRTFAGKYEEIPVKYGQVEYGTIFAGGLYGIGLFTQMDGLRTTGRLLIQSLAYSGSTLLILHWALGRSRPFLTDNPWKFNWFEPRSSMQSFPSGHATVSFALSTILSNRIKNSFVTVGLFGLTVLDGFFRIYDNQHWLSDVMIGSALGIGTSLYVISQEEKRTSISSQGQSKLSIIPSNGGIKIVYQF
jgi:PAP2 superfamily